MQGTTTTDFALDGQSVVRTFTNGVADKTYLHGARGPEYERIGNNAPQWYLYDGLGSVLGTVDSAGNVTSARKYDVYGAVRGLTGQSGSRHKWVGGLGHPSEDETGLVYMRARYYDPVTGRFASEDPEKDGQNWFPYASGNPVCFQDPSGGRVASSWSIFEGISAIYGAVAAAALITFLVVRSIQAKLKAQEVFLAASLAEGHASGQVINGRYHLRGSLTSNTRLLMQEYAATHAQVQRMERILGAAGVLFVTATTAYGMYILAEWAKSELD